jgi:hypothetical protein
MAEEEVIIGQMQVPFHDVCQGQAAIQATRASGDRAEKQVCQGNYWFHGVVLLHPSLTSIAQGLSQHAGWPGWKTPCAMMVLAAAMALRREDNTRTLSAGRGHNDPLTDGSTSKMVWRRRGKMKTCGTGRVGSKQETTTWSGCSGMRGLRGRSPTTPHDEPAQPIAVIVQTGWLPCYGGGSLQCAACAVWRFDIAAQHMELRQQGSDSSPPPVSSLSGA